jgi:hypothetical protein
LCGVRLVPMRWLNAASLCLLAGCAQPVSARLEVAVTDDGGRPLAGAVVEVDGVRVASSTRQGLASATVHAPRPGRMSVAVRCPAGFRSPAARSVPLVADTPRLELALACRPAARTLAVAVRAPAAPGAWVRADGQPIGQLGADGTFHGLLVRPPGSELRLAIDTGEHPELRPQHPVRQVQVGDRDEIVVFDAQLEPAPRPAPRPRARAAPNTTRPYAIKAER